MSFSVKMPALGESVTEGTVTRWLKKEGEFVKVDEPLLEVSTDKVDTEIPSPSEGVLQKIIVQVDQTVAVGTELAVIDSAGAPAAPKPAAPVSTPQPAAPKVEAPAAAAANNQSSSVNQTSANQTIVVMPALGESVTEGTVTRWLKKVGDVINVDEPLLEVSTDKVDTEIPSPSSGTLQSIEVPVDSTVPVGARLAVIASSAGVSATPAAPQNPKPVAAQVSKPVVSTPAAVAAAPVSTAVKPAVTTAAAPAATSIPSYAAATTNSKTSDLYVTPIVRKLASENGVNLATVSGTGIGGRIRKEDVMAAISRPATTNFVATQTSNKIGRAHV